MKKPHRPIPRRWILYPSIYLVCDPHSERAESRVLGMLAALGAAGCDRVQAARGSGWAAAVIPPPASEPTSGADICGQGDDIILWTGEVLLPPGCAPSSPSEPPPRAISETLLAQLRRRSLETLADLDGAFCGAWYDGQSRKWMVFNDRFGQIPVFWAAGPNALIVAPRASVAWQAGGESLQIDGLGVASLLRTQNMIGDHTLIRGVHWLEPGCRLEWGPRGSQTRPYWDFRYDGAEARDPQEGAEAYVAMLGQIVRQCSACRSPMLLGISGGLDSRLLLAMCAQMGRVPACFTAGFEFAEDVRFGRHLARAAGTTHDWAPLNEERLAGRLTDAIVETDGLHSAAHLPPSVAAREYLARNAGAVLLEGFFHGVLGGAEVPCEKAVAGDSPPHRSDWARSLLHSGGSFELMNALLMPETARDSFQSWQEEVDKAHAEAPTDDPLRKAEHVVVRGRLGRIDTIGMAFLRRDVLVRGPGTHKAMVEWYQLVPPRMRHGREIYVDVLRRRFPRFARVQRSNSSALPIAAHRWLREYHWQREKLHRWWAGRRYPVLRRWGAAGTAIRAWTFETWRASGGLDMLREPHARVLQWVRRETLLDLWARAAADPLEGMPLLSVATAETMIRWLESHAGGLLAAGRAAAERVHFRHIGSPPQARTDRQPALALRSRGSL